jgi:CBS domain-containing protein
VNPYGTGRAATTIAAFLRTVPLDRLLVRKGFVDLPAPARRRNPRDFTVPSHASLREAAACIDRNRTGIAVVVDHNGRLLDTITDGDIRRALLMGRTLDAKAAELRPRRGDGPYPEPVVAVVAESDMQMLSKMRARKVQQVPVVREDRVVVDLVTLHDLNESCDEAS